MTDLERRILDFEAQWWQSRGNKEAAIRELFGWSAVRYVQKLNRLIDNPEALAHDPHLVNRLLRIRSQRDVARTQRKAVE